MSTAWNIASHSAVLLLESAAPRTANHSFTLRARAATVAKRSSLSTSLRPTAWRKARTWGSVLIVTAIQPSAVRNGLLFGLPNRFVNGLAAKIGPSSLPVEEILARAAASSGDRREQEHSGAPVTSNGNS